MSRSINKTNKKLVIPADIRSGYLSKEFFNEYLSDYCDKKTIKQVNTLFDKLSGNFYL